MMKFRLPRFLTPRRKYEVNESHWLVIWGRPKIRRLMQVARPVGPVVVHEARRAERILIRVGRKAVPRLASGWRRGISGLANGGRMVGLFFQWRRIPKKWELSFVRKMKSMEIKGIQFPEVLEEYLPSIIGEAPSEVLLNWVGRTSRHQPKRFVNVVRKMFGKSSKSIISGLETLADPEKMLADRMPVEPPYQSLVDAIKAADGE